MTEFWRGGGVAPARVGGRQVSDSYLGVLSAMSLFLPFLYIYIKGPDREWSDATIVFVSLHLAAWQLAMAVTMIVIRLWHKGKQSWKESVRTRANCVYVCVCVCVCTCVYRIEINTWCNMGTPEQQKSNFLSLSPDLQFWALFIFQTGIPGR